jgi:hypothetical protein
LDFLGDFLRPLDFLGDFLGPFTLNLHEATTTTPGLMQA